MLGVQEKNSLDKSKKLIDDHTSEHSQISRTKSYKNDSVLLAQKSKATA